MQSGRLANIVRGIALLVSVAAAYFAQYLFIRDSVSALLPAWLVNAFPFLSRFLYRPASGMLIAVLWTFVFAAVIFGFVTPVRDRNRPRTRAQTQPSSHSQRDDSAGVQTANAVDLRQPIDAAPAAGIDGSVLRPYPPSWRFPLAAAGILALLAALLFAFTPVAWLAYVLQACAAGLYLWAGVERQRSVPSKAMDKLLSVLDALPQNGVTDSMFRALGKTRAAPIPTLPQSLVADSQSEATYGRSGSSYGHYERCEESRRQGDPSPTICRWCPSG